MDTSILEDIGITESEKKVFLTLLEVGSSRAGPIVEKSGQQNAVVHRALHSLINKGLVTFIHEGKKKIYQSIEPKLLLNFIDEKRDRLVKLIPELTLRKEINKKQPQAEIYKGIRGIKELLTLLHDTSAKEHFGYGGAQRSHDLLGNHFWESYHKKRIQKKIKAYLIFHNSLRWWGDKLGRWPMTKLHYTSKTFEELTETIICGDRVGILIFSDNPYGFLIKDEQVAISYKHFFGILWKNSK